MIMKSAARQEQTLGATVDVHKSFFHWDVVWLDLND